MAVLWTGTGLGLGLGLGRGLGTGLGGDGLGLGGDGLGGDGLGLGDGRLGLQRACSQTSSHPGVDVSAQAGWSRVAACSWASMYTIIYQQRHETKRWHWQG